MAKNTAEVFREIRSAIGDGELDEAWQHMQPLLSFPTSTQLTADELAALLSFFERVCPRVATTALAEVVHATRDNLDDLRSLTDLGHCLLEHGFHAIAATPLSMANRLAAADDCETDELSAMLGQALAHARTPLVVRAAS